ncbi:MAG: hypothetical protein JO362_18065, partial [Streptomycetaceae bacterium]|nr:hypothetical protein [Streptomycetaceae bacterium]
LRGDLVRKNHRSGLGRLTNALRTLIQTEYLTPGTHLPGRKLARHLANPDILPKTVSNAYMQLRHQGLAIAGQGRGTRVAGPAESPASALPADWLERLQHEMEGDRWFEQVLRTHLLNLPPHTLLPPHEKLAELLDLPETSDILLKNAYSRLAEGGLLVRGSNDTRVADHNGPVHPVTAPQTSQTAGATRPTTNDSHPLLPITWVRDLRSELENNPFNPSSGREKATWFAQALERNIQSLEHRTRLPSFVQLAEQLKGAGVNTSLVQRAYTHLKEIGQLTAEFGKGTWVAKTRDAMDPATGPGLPQARTEQDEPPLPTDPLLDIPELDETQLQELWETLEAEEPRATPPVMPGTRLDPHADRAAQATAHLTDPSHLPHLPHPDVHDILSLLSRTGRPRPHALNPGRPMTGTWNQGAAEQ